MGLDSGIGILSSSIPGSEFLSSFPVIDQAGSRSGSESRSRSGSESRSRSGLESRSRSGSDSDSSSWLESKSRVESPRSEISIDQGFTIPEIPRITITEEDRQEFREQQQQQRKQQRLNIEGQRQEEGQEVWRLEGQLDQ